MAKKRSVDPGLRYLQEIGFDRIRGKYGLADRWSRVFGKEKMEKRSSLLIVKQSKSGQIFLRKLQAQIQNRIGICGLANVLMLVEKIQKQDSSTFMEKKCLKE